MFLVCAYCYFFCCDNKNKKNNNKTTGTLVFDDKAKTMTPIVKTYIRNEGEMVLMHVSVLCLLCRASILAYFPTNIPFIRSVSCQEDSEASPQALSVKQLSGGEKAFSGYMPIFVHVGRGKQPRIN